MGWLQYVLRPNLKLHLSLKLEETVGPLLAPRLPPRGLLFQLLLGSRPCGGRFAVVLGDR